MRRYPTPILPWSTEQYYQRYVTRLAAHHGIPERHLATYIEWREATRAFTTTSTAA